MSDKTPVIVLGIAALLIVAEAAWMTAVRSSASLPFDTASTRLASLDRLHPFRQDAADQLAEIHWQQVMETGNYAHAELAYDAIRARLGKSADPRWLSRTAWLAVVLHQDLHPETNNDEMQK